MGMAKKGCLGFFILIIILGIVGACMGPSGEKSSNTVATEKVENAKEKYWFS